MTPDQEERTGDRRTDPSWHRFGDRRHAKQIPILLHPFQYVESPTHIRYLLIHTS